MWMSLLDESTQMENPRLLLTSLIDPAARCGVSLNARERWPSEVAGHDRLGLAEAELMRRKAEEPTRRERLSAIASPVAAVIDEAEQPPEAALAAVAEFSIGGLMKRPE
ncbi:hypothetical protein MTO96_021224 [Rhipicephalus appendiculatus]